MKNNAFATTIRTEGALLPADLLRRVQAGDKTLHALTPDAYNLPGGMRLNEAASRAWNALLGAWTTFQEARERLPEGELGTTVTRERWLLPLFQELNYGRLQQRTAVEFEGKSYAVSHGYGHAPVHLVGCNVNLDKRTRGVAGAATASPHSLVQELLNRSDEHLWGVVSNGLRLRVLRDNKSLTRQAYLEFDLEAMMEGEQYSDFVVLFLLLHQSRLESRKPEESILEQWSQEAAETGARALDSLRAGVEQAISAFGKGFLRGSNSDLKGKLQNGDLSTIDFYRQLLRLVYRLLFLFVTEDRNVLHTPNASPAAKERFQHYSTQRLRELSASLLGGRHEDLYEGQKVVMSVLGKGGEPRLALPELGGFLFGEEALPNLMSARLPNAYFLKGVRALAFTDSDGARRPVDYKNLGSEELGSVYESLLELHPDVDMGALEFRLETEPGNERRTSGSYYTPRSLINSLLNAVLDPAIENAVRGKDSDRAEQALLDLRVVDPAVGSGHFLIAAAQRIARRLANIRSNESEPSPVELQRALRDVIGRTIYGVDINEMSAELCKVALWLEAMEPGKPLTFLDHHIRAGNSLIGAPANQGLGELVAKGIPDEAFGVMTDDERRTATALRLANRQERQGSGRLFTTGTTVDPVLSLGQMLNRLDVTDEDIESVRRKENLYRGIIDSDESRTANTIAGAYVGAFVWPKRPRVPRPITTDDLHILHQGKYLTTDRLVCLEQLSKSFGFFHWRLEFADVFERKGGFDVVLGNPPYGDLMEKKPKALAKHRFPLAAPAKNVAADFIQLASEISNDEGLIGFVVPKSLTFSATWRAIRHWLKPRLIEVVDAGKAWREVLLEQVTVAYRKVPDGSALHAPPRLGRFVNETLNYAPELGTIAGTLDSIPTGFSEKDIEIFQALDLRGLGLLGEICRTQRGTPIQRFIKLEGDIPVLGGRSIGEMVLNEPTGYVSREIGARLRMTVPPQAVFQNIVSHVTQPQDHIKLIGTVVEGEYACADTVNLIQSTNKSLTPFAIAAYLASDFVNWYVYLAIYNRAIRTMHFDNYVLEQIPLLDDRYFEELDRLGRALIERREVDTNEELNDLVGRALGLTSPLIAALARMRRAQTDLVRQR